MNHKPISILACGALLFILAAALSGCNQGQPTLPALTQPPTAAPTAAIPQPTEDVKLKPSATPSPPGIDFSKIANGFVEEKGIQKNILGALHRMGLADASVVVANDEIRIGYEQPVELLPGELRIVYLTVFNTASRFAPYFKNILIVAAIGGEPFIGLQMAVEDIRAYRHLELDEESLLSRMIIFAPDEIPQ